MKPIPLSLCVWCLAFSDLRAQGTSGSPPSPAPRCSAAEYRQFDFWIGDWTVTSGGEQAGTNNVTLEENGRLIHEHWTARDGGTGQSLNYFDRSDQKWHQVWIDAQGGILQLAGTYVDNRLTLTGERPTLLHKLSFFRNSDGTVRQLWESSRDGGKTWKTVFDGLYKKKG
jgi:hypothetical protein